MLYLKVVLLVLMVFVVTMGVDKMVEGVMVRKYSLT